MSLLKICFLLSVGVGLGMVTYPAAFSGCCAQLYGVWSVWFVHRFFGKKDDK